MINECIIVSKEVGDKFILAKNRDRTYNPELEIVHTIIDGVEVAYLHDLIIGINGKSYVTQVVAVYMWEATFDSRDYAKGTAIAIVHR